MIHEDTYTIFKITNIVYRMDIDFTAICICSGCQTVTTELVTSALFSVLTTSHSDEYLCG